MSRPLSSQQVHSFWPAMPPPAPVRLTVLPEHPCGYLPDRMEQTRAFRIRSLDPESYVHFMNAGFRRSGDVIYQPMCRGCRACQPIRLPVAKFQPSKSQRRCYRRNSDLAVCIAVPEPSEEKFDLYSRYRREWHGKEDEADFDAFVSFLYSSPTLTLEWTYRDQSGKLLAVGICDVASTVLSSVYFYFDPGAARRGLGTYGALRELQFARHRSIDYYYLGFWIQGCPAMEYKSAFRPSEILWPDQVWRASPVDSDGVIGGGATPVSIE